MDLGRIKELIQLVEKSDINGLAIEDGGFKIELRKSFDGIQYGVAPAEVAAIAVAATKEPVKAAAPAKEPAKDANLTPIKSPVSGTFYTAPSPGEPPFVSVGNAVSKGQTVCVIEAMKTFNEIESDVSGTIAKVLIQDGQPVEIGQPLFLVK